MPPGRESRRSKGCRQSGMGAAALCSQDWLSQPDTRSTGKGRQSFCTDEKTWLFHAHCVQPPFHQRRPLPDGKFGRAQAKGMLSLRVQMQFSGNACVLQCNVIRDRVIHAIHIVILGLHQKRGGCLLIDWRVCVESVVLAAGPEVSWVHGYSEIRSTADLIDCIASWIETF